MDTVEEIEAAVARLSTSELAAFRRWYTEFDAELWDRQLDADVAAGRLDWLVEETLRDRDDGRCTDR
jgi:hypothetical protein